jgi:hypothetical protein
MVEWHACKGKIVEAARVQRSKGAGEKEEILGIAFRYLEIPLCTPAPLQSLRHLPFSLTSVPFVSWSACFFKRRHKNRDSVSLH